MKATRGIVLHHGGWIIERYPYGYEVYHESDRKKKHVTFPSTLAHALTMVHERLLLQQRPDGYDGSLEAFRRVLDEVNHEFTALLTPNLRDEAGNRRRGGHE